MITVARIIDELNKRKLAYAEAALSRPSGKEAFDYGVAVGTYLAFEDMLNHIRNTIEEDAENERKKEAKK